ncbi:MAG TPA: hypothetical protein VGN44_11800 [Candidatus Angelobacter sp.]|jgi:hypothetical protein
MKSFRLISCFIVIAAALTLSGCRSHVVKVNLKNTSTDVVKTIIVDYPTATFGKDKLAPNEIFSYAIKPLEPGMLKIQFTDALGTIHSYVGTPLHKDDDGVLDVNLSQSGAVVTGKLSR